MEEGFITTKSLFIVINGIKISGRNGSGVRGSRVKGSTGTEPEVEREVEVKNSEKK